jgi:tetratricopeptide (TPR) repeat protein
MGRPAEAEEESALAESLSREDNPPHQTAQTATLSGGELTAKHSPAGNEAASGPAYAPVFDDLRGCLETEDAACASSALAAIRDPEVLGTSDYFELKAQTFGLQHRQREALAAIQTAIEGNASQPHYLITQGRLYLEFGQPMDAVASFLIAAKLEPDSPEPLYFLGTTFFLLAQNNHSPDYYRRAINHFQSALQVSPDYPRAEFMLGVIDAVQSRLEDARKHLQRAIQLEPSNPYYHLHYGILLKHTGDDRGALSEMQTAEEMNPSYALTHFEIGTVYEKLGQYTDAKRELQAALEFNPGLSAPYYHLGAVFARLGYTEESKAAFARFNVMKEQATQPNSDPAASAISDEDRDR